MKKILIVDDKKNLREVMRVVLERMNYSVMEAEDGYLGMEMLEENDVDLVIMDHVMPGKTGIEMLFELKDRDDLKKIVITGQIAGHKDNFRHMARKYGAEDVLHKPFRLQKFIELVKDTVEPKRETYSYYY